MKRQVSFINAIIAIIIMALAFLGLIYSYPFGNFYLLIGGVLSLYILGYDLKSLIRPLKKKDVFLIIKAILLSIGLSLIMLLIGNLLDQPSAANPITEGLNWTILLYTIPALFGEELLVIVMLVILEKILPKTRNGIITASIISAFIFGACHLSTYDWNLWQSIVVIGFTRLPFTYAWYKSDKNLLVNGLSHYLYDNLLFLITVLA
ncbi:CPBP family glutamic-type intramembrane protease [Breznakia pachnodae]|uniref:Membrane protein n=1 Tax=Breznakia pachnodae TaxID=265178 RepID=A0ABU0E8J4_9FIRM|nr:CPBP family glutamic-type intramembrane protease [Breznakia pachnodae]MDQ0363202.1 putative membrane protein [Breznakia pachnodae]